MGTIFFLKNESGWFMLPNESQIMNNHDVSTFTNNIICGLWKQKWTQDNKKNLNVSPVHYLHFHFLTISCQEWNWLGGLSRGSWTPRRGGFPIPKVFIWEWWRQLEPMEWRLLFPRGAHLFPSLLHHLMYQVVEEACGGNWTPWGGSFSMGVKLSQFLLHHLACISWWMTPVEAIEAYGEGEALSLWSLVVSLSPPLSGAPGSKGGLQRQLNLLQRGLSLSWQVHLRGPPFLRGSPSLICHLTYQVAEENQGGNWTPWGGRSPLSMGFVCLPLSSTP